MTSSAIAAVIPNAGTTGPGAPVAGGSPTASLLAPDLASGRDDLLDALGMGYSAKMGEPMLNFALWKNGQSQIVAAIKERYAAMGLEAAPLLEDSLWMRLELAAPASDPQMHMRLLRAMLTDYTERFWRQFEYRRKHGGNVHGQVVGPTGMAKSSCVGTIADINRPIQPGRLKEHIAIDPSDLAERFRGKVPGDTVWMDELLALFGDGARTLAGMLGNVDDTLRASGVDFWTASPELETTSATQMQLEVVLWSPPAVIRTTAPDGTVTTHYFCRRCGTPWKGGYCKAPGCNWHPWSLFIVWVKGVPHGVVGLRWMPAHLWEEYAPWKAGNVERTMKTIFKDRSFTAKQALKILCHPGVVRYLKTFDDAKPGIGDFEELVDDRAEASMTSDQRKTVARTMKRMTFRFQRLSTVDPDTGRTLFEELYGVAPPPEVKTLAALWEGGDL